MSRVIDAIIQLTDKFTAPMGNTMKAMTEATAEGAATENSLGLVGTAVKAAKAGFTDTATAIDGLTTVYNSFQGKVDYSKLSDQMLQTQNYGKTTFGELASLSLIHI